MVSRTLIIIAIILWSCRSNDLDNGALQADSFNIEKDFLLVQYDCKTDVDDLHTIAAFFTLMSDPNFSKINYHAVAGTYGIQSGLYVPPNPLLELAFKDNWTDAHNNTQTAVEQVRSKITATLLNKGDVWIAEAGQSDFTAELIKSIQANLPEINTSENIHVVQHSDWNEKSTSPEDLEFVKKNTDYHKIPDGNVVGNGTPGFLTAEYTQWKDKITNPQLIEVWELAIEISNEYNGKDGRYNNKAISQGGMDFSDLSEVCWILGINDIKDTAEFFNIYSN
ncbi:hypothetical protein SAMN03080594_10326 [Arenibacter palladensis]|uniref:Uncharacterized protein n=1 Tax=Arenibacter palladensis TaxID=237373 RepID=A0A1M5A0K2_9FLAO|nr:hypothetical protein [Arenibacter palladensis]SHF23416.1 hypothetical protein SAMN03080594_10326 [Arenibacter palladensis]